MRLQDEADNDDAAPDVKVPGLVAGRQGRGHAGGSLLISCRKKERFCTWRREIIMKDLEGALAFQCAFGEG